MASVCRSLQHLILALTSGQRWSLVQIRFFSRAAGREGRCTQMSLACVGSTRRVPVTLGLPRSRVCAFPVYTAQAPGCSIWSGPCVACGSSFWVLHGSADSVGPAFCAFPAPAAQAARSLTGTLSTGAARLLPLSSPSLSFHMPGGCVRLVSVLGSWPLAATLPANVNHTESQEVFG